MSYIGKQPTKAPLTASDIEDGIITAAKIEDGAVVAAEIASNAVTTAKINADAVTAAKIADNVISEEHLDVTAITGHTAETTVADGDLVVIHDASATALRKMTVANLTANAGVAGISSSADATAMTINSSESVGINNTNMASFDADARNLVVGSGSGDNGLTIYSDGSSSGSIFFGNGTTGTQTKQGQIVYEQNNNAMIFSTAATERFRVTSAGLHIGGTGAANALDDYEEGTWTPTFNRSSSQITIAILRANYTKIGRLVHCTMHAVNNDGAKNNAYIVGDGLPFTSASINVTGVGGTFAIHAGSGNANADVGAAGSWTQDNDWYMVPSHNGTNGYRYLYDWANGHYIEAAFWYYAA